MGVPRAPASSIRPFLAALVAGLLALHWWWGMSALVGTSVTNDEPVHLASGYAYWKFNDYRMQPENGNLPQRWAALPLLAMHPRLEPADDPEQWRVSGQWRISNRFVFLSGNNADYMIFCARAAMALWSVATALLVFCWSRRLWGDSGGLLSLVLYVVCPTVLANGPLVTSDMCAAFWLLAAIGAWWRVCRRVSWGSLLLSCAATGFAFVAKYSAVLLLPAFALLIIWRAVAKEPVELALRHPASPRNVTSTPGKLALLLAALAVHGAATWVIIWTFFGWRYGAFAPGLPAALSFYLPTDLALSVPGRLREWILAAFRWQILPQAYLHGFAHVRYQGSARGAFLLGLYSNTGWWWFFPYAFLAKSTIGELLAAAALTLAAAFRWARSSPLATRLGLLARDCGRLAPLLTLALVYWTFSVFSTLNIGHRHILPMYPALFIVAGALLRQGAGRWLRATAIAVALASTAESLAVRPHYLAFFNVLAGGPTAGWRQLVDSSLDWGQDLPALAQWVRSHRQPGENVYVSYFGTGHPSYEGLHAIKLSPYYTFGRTRRWTELGPGLYCISATMLQDVYSNFRGDWTLDREHAYQRLLKGMRSDLAAGRRSPLFADMGMGPNNLLWDLDRLRFARLCLYLRLRAPDAVIGYSQFVFRLNEEEIHTVVDGTLAELSALMERAEKRKNGG